ncbi:MAG: phosphotransferase [Pseudomonadota bacterium]
MTPPTAAPPPRPEDAPEDRQAARDAFVRDAGWADAAAEPLAGDASTRRYVRLRRRKETALLMDAPAAAESAVGGPDADPQTRRALGYNALARLAGPNLNAFVEIAGALRAGGLSAPDIYAVDAEQGFALIEDLGDGLFASVAPRDPLTEETLYAAAADTLATWAIAAPKPPRTDAYAMLDYDRHAMDAEIALFTEHYWKHQTGRTPAKEDAADFATAFGFALDGLGAPDAIVLRDFHAENLLWLPERDGPARVGVIDFQDALYGGAAYDVVSLLEDARRDVAPRLARATLERYCAARAAAGGFDLKQFEADYAVLAAQRNAKILGIFARLAHRDGKRRYLDFMPRVEAHFRADLARPPMAPLADFIRSRLPDLAP